jgi:hypothetical protein
MQPEAMADAVVVLVKNALGPVLERLAAAEARLAVLGDVRDRLVTVETKTSQPVIIPTVEPIPPLDLSPMLERIAATETRLAVLGDLRDRLVVIETKTAQPVVAPTMEPAAPVDLSPVLERVAAAEARLEVLGDLRDRVVVVETKSAQPVHEPSAVDLSPVLDRVSALEVGMRMKFSETEPILAKVADLTQEHAALRERVAVAEMRQLIQGPPGHDGRDGIPGRDGKDGLDGLGWDDLSVAQLDERTFTVKCLRGLQVKELGTLTFPVEIYRGVYQDGKTYERGDCVTYGGSEFHCNETTFTKPEQSKAWTLKVKRGRDGKDGRDAMSTPVVSVKR